MRRKVKEVDGLSTIRVLRNTHEFDGKFYRPRPRLNRWKNLFAARHPFLAWLLRIGR